jgi:small GTP-binding protein
MVEESASLYKSTDSAALKQFKVICVGESMAGKTSLIQRYIMESFSEHGTQTTLSWDFKIKTIYIDSDSNDEPGSLVSRGTSAREQVRMFVWDTAGQERFRQIARMYYRDSNGALICYDITN